MDALNNLEEAHNYMYDRKYRLNDGDLFANQALKLLYDKKLLGTLNKAISDTAISCYSYIYKKKRGSSNQFERSNENILQCIELFSTDLIEVLSSIIRQSKNKFVNEQLGEQPTSNGFMQVLQTDRHSENESPSASQNYNSEINALITSTLSPHHVSKDNLKTPGSKRPKAGVKSHKNLHSNLKSNRNHSPYNFLDTELSQYTRNCGWIHKSMDKGSK